MANAVTFFTALAMALGAQCAGAQEWPTRTIRLVSPFAPGGGSDTVARAVAERLNEQLPQQVIVENRGGAGGLIGSAVVANAPPDGYTYVVSSIATHVIAPLTSKTDGYDPIRNFTHVALAGGPPTVIVVHPSLGPKSYAELLKLLKARTEPLPYVSPGPGTIGHLIAEHWAEQEGFKLSHVPYKGAGQAMSDLVAGHVPLGSITWTAAISQIRGGMVLPIAVSSSRRMPDFPDLPTLKELGYPDLAITTWFAFAAPAGVPAPIVARMNQEIGVALDAPAVRKHLDSQGFEIEKMMPAELTAFIENQISKWGPLARRLADRR